MAALGDKVSANILAQTALVPSIPWSGGGITAELNEEGVIPKEIFDSACVFDVEGAVTTAEKIGYPVMIKASEGGGGKGIRMANNLEELKSGFAQVKHRFICIYRILLGSCIAYTIFYVQHIPFFQLPTKKLMILLPLLSS